MSCFRFRIGLFLLAILLLLPLCSSCVYSSDDIHRIAHDASQYRFNLFTWEVKTLAGKIIRPLIPGHKKADSEEKLIETRVREAFSRQEIHNPAGNFLKISFPPTTLFLGPPPRLLVISPRDKIEAVDEIMLSPDMTVLEMESLENKVEKLGYSGLVIDLGGMATVPSYVSNDADIKFILESTAHEWVHQYLAFTPLGFRYVLDKLGIHQSQDLITINETVADIIGNEIGDEVFWKYYAPPATNNASVPSTFDFNGTMRLIRQTVDAYLTKGEIDFAESYMSDQREYLVAHGYQIRKLNQAYFAFYGTYGDSPTSASPIGGELNTLRNRSVSLKDFIDKASAITSIDDLNTAVR
jgi:hypothetical protein